MFAQTNRHGQIAAICNLALSIRPAILEAHLSASKAIQTMSKCTMYVAPQTKDKTMKYLLLAFLFLAGCASKPVNKEYDCSVVNGHGSYARMEVLAVDEEQAILTTNEVIKKLIDKKLVPDNCEAFCSQRLREYPRGK